MINVHETVNKTIIFNDGQDDIPTPSLLAVIPL